MKPANTKISTTISGLALAVSCITAQASSHMDAPMITLDPAANTTDVYAFRSDNDKGQYLTAAVAVYPFEEPGIGPNIYSFDDDVLYQIHVSTGDDVAAGRKTISYQFKFKTKFQNKQTILQAYLGKLNGDKGPKGFDVNQNLQQTYKVFKLDHRTGKKTKLGKGLVPPNNQGLVTPFYNQENNGENFAKPGVNSKAELDMYTRHAVVDLKKDYQVFAGQRDDGFYADIQSIFDLDFGFGGPNKPFDSQGGFNVHTIALNIPLEELEGYGKTIGVYTTTSRRQFSILNQYSDDINFGRWVQVGRQGNPLFNEGFVGIEDKDLYNRSSPVHDAAQFKTYALNPQLATVLGLDDKNRQDLAGIFIPDTIKVDITTGPAQLAGTINDPNFDRRSVFGGDTLINSDGEEVAGGFPNGRRFGDDVLEIALNALGVPAANIDGVSQNDITFNKTFPYAATPHNGRNHVHH